MDATPAKVALQTLPIRDLDVPSAALRIRGPDSNTFLQGQFTQDLRKPVGSCSYGLWLNQKGKALADSFVLRVAEQEFIVWSARTDGILLRQRIEDYLIADEVEIVDAAAEGRDAVVIWGHGAGTAVARHFGAVPQAGAFVASAAGVVFGGRFSAAENFVCLATDATALRGAFEQAGATRGTRDTLEAARIAGALPAVPDDIGPGDLPNEGGLDVDAISYTKGCYLGQEVMSRLKNLGQVRRRLMVVAGPGEPPPAHTALRQGEKTVGETRSRARVGDGFVAMAMVSLVNFDRAAPLALADGRAIELRHG
ncbi:YgfZ/GcvT domain-containing protein [Oleiharenicola sp. Vm1]|uniref:CAF17-like 4Fe-4S cluster assembly/insertion protein YgfZ n=1 Tax=Oleiharenicola sp. Vm1 TaxID=3398393 RepID=UPI0039F54DCC